MTPTDLLDFVEASGRFMEPALDTVIRKTPRFTLVANRGDTWAAVEGIRLDDGRASAAVDEVNSFLLETGTQIASWWLTERTTPADAEAQLHAAGVERVENDYLVDGLVITTAPPAGPPEIETRPVASVDEHVEARRLQYDVFGTPPERRRSDEALAGEYGRIGTVFYGAWIDGRLAGAAGAAFASRGALLVGGATLSWARGRGAYRALVRARWDDAAGRGTPALTVGAGPMSAPILKRLGFEKALQFRRLESRRARPESVPGTSGSAT